MKVPPKRKGNDGGGGDAVGGDDASMKVPPKRKGNLDGSRHVHRLRIRLNESPSEKEGKWGSSVAVMKCERPQ